MTAASKGSGQALARPLLSALVPKANVAKVGGMGAGFVFKSWSERALPAGQGFGDRLAGSTRCDRIAPLKHSLTPALRCASPARLPLAAFGTGAGAAVPREHHQVYGGKPQGRPEDRHPAARRHHHCGHWRAEGRAGPPEPRCGERAACAVRARHTALCTPAGTAPLGLAAGAAA